MDPNFWHQKWETNRIGFHEHQVNPLLVNNFDQLRIQDSGRVFVPLCGKTLDIAWLLSQGHQVVGVELSEIAIKQLFAELEIEPTITELKDVTHYSATNIDIFVGDIFKVTRQILGSVHAVFDRAALVALPEATRIQYAKHIIHITDNARQLLITYDYPPTLMQGPPFSISQKEINQHYEANYKITHLEAVDIGGGLNVAKENVWLLR